MNSTMKLGNQLAVMHWLATNNHAPVIKQMWKSVQEVSDANNVSIEAVPREKVIDTLRPPLSQFVSAFAKRASGQQLQAEKIDYWQIPSYDRLNIITHDAAQALMTSAALLWGEKIDLSKLGGRIEAAYQFLFLTTNGYNAPNATVENFKLAIKHYGIEANIADNFVAGEATLTDLLANIGPPIENDLATTVLNNPMWNPLKQKHGITRDVLFRAWEQGILSLDMVHGLLNAITAETSFNSAIRLARRDLLLAAFGTGLISGGIFASELLLPSSDDIAASLVSCAPAVLLAVVAALLLIFRGGYSAKDKNKIIFLEHLERPFKKDNPNKDV